MEYLVSASILSADVAQLANVAKKLKISGADMLHFDVMDGVFVDNITFGAPVLESLKKHSDLFMDVHLMIIDPLKYIKQFSESGADLITFHFESESKVEETINEIKKYGKKVGISIKPNTPVQEIFPFLNNIDMILIMTVEPGFGGQGFIYDTLSKIKLLRDHINENKLNIDIQVDGGINSETASIVKEAGANILVSGSYLFNSNDLKEAVAILKS